jgi:nucleotidyltransferase/DNA polymerase involved in DNA repair
LGDDGENGLTLRKIPGIGKALEKKLRRAGYKSAAQLAGENAQRLADRIEGLTVARAEKILSDTRKLVKKKIKK